ncbi:MAG: hypothetical protein K0Q92_1862 [Steroidobacteraceae bacterium]|jgi:hypothetical protein|nr:hypothetical protein [Steroidobacteraceae bacterium]
MKANKTLLLAVAAAALLAAGLFLTLHRSSEQAELGGGAVFSDLKPALAQVDEIHLSKGDGSSTTLRKEATGWTVVERAFPADAQRVRELALALADLRMVERKTADPANYARLGVEDTDSPTAASTLVEVVAGDKTWKLIVGKSAEGRGVYARKPGEAASFLASPLITADPDQKRWIDRLIIDLPGAKVHEISARIGKGPTYLLTRAEPGATELALSPVPKGRTAASSMALSGQADALASFHFDDVRTATEDAAGPDTVTYRTFDGQVITFTGRREGDKAFVTVTATRDAELAAKFAPRTPTPATPEPIVAPPPPAGEAIAAAPEPAADKTPPVEDKSAERLSARSQGVEFEIPVYKYEAIFRPYEQTLEPKAGAAR